VIVSASIVSACRRGVVAMINPAVFVADFAGLAFAVPVYRCDTRGCALVEGSTEEPDVPGGDFRFPHARRHNRLQSSDALVSTADRPR
jgi:hypothetical protein